MQHVTSGGTLSKLPNSKLKELLAIALQKPNDSVFVDSNPDVFKTLLEFVRMDRKYLPKNVSNDQKEQTEVEFKHWKVT